MALVEDRDLLDRVEPEGKGEQEKAIHAYSSFYAIEDTPRRFSNRWAVVLAGGEGERLKPLTKVICGDERPKQFCPLFEDGQTLLGRTLQRLQLLVRPEQTLVSLTAHQRKWYEQEPDLAAEMRLVQPLNRGTAPPIAASLLSIAKIDEDAVVGIFPSDHYYADEPLFAAQLETAFASAEVHSGVVLLGAQPSSPEPGFGWIELGSSVEAKGELYRVHGFQEKPAVKIAEKLMRRNSLWNTFVMVGRVGAFLEMLGAALPQLTATLAHSALWNGTETYIDRARYDRIPASDFSRQVLSAEKNRLFVMRLGEVGWNDLGDPERVIETISAMGLAPVWAMSWKRRIRIKSWHRGQIAIA